jgi:Ser/Thr protein kinase RdoA (MazF antagonist)
VLAASAERAELQAVIDASGATLGDRSSVQHGDFTIENIVVDEQTARVTVVDWEHAVTGLPPLYDCFSLLISLLAVMPVPASTYGSIIETNFRAGFLRSGRWTPLIAYLLALACEQQATDPARVWPSFLQFLALRTHFFARRGSTGAAAESARMLEAAWKQRDRFLFPPPSA